MPKTRRLLTQYHNTLATLDADDAAKIEDLRIYMVEQSIKTRAQLRDIHEAVSVERIDPTFWHDLRTQFPSLYRAILDLETHYKHERVDTQVSKLVS